MARALTPGGIERIPHVPTFPPPVYFPTPPAPVYAGPPARGAGSRCTSCADCSCAEDDGSAVVGSDDGDTGGGGGGGGGGVGSDVACVGLGSPFDGAGCCGRPFPSPFPVAPPEGFASPDPDADGDAVPDADSPGLTEAPPLTPVLPWNQKPPPPTADSPCGASPARRPAECEGPGLPPSSLTLIQPAAAATAMTVAARRTDTYKARTGSHLRGGGSVSPPCPTPAAHKKTRAENTHPAPGLLPPAPCRSPHPYPSACNRSSSIPK